MTLATSVAARQGPIAMAGHQICLQVWLAVSLLTDALAASAQVKNFSFWITFWICSHKSFSFVASLFSHLISLYLTFSFIRNKIYIFILVKLKRWMRGPYHKVQNLIKVRLYSSTVQGELLIKACTKYFRNQNQTFSNVIHPFWITNRKPTK